MKAIRAIAALGALLAPAGLRAQAVADEDSNALSGSFSPGGATAYVTGDKGKYEQDQQRDTSSGGLEALHLSKNTSDTATLTIDARAVAGDDNFLFHLNWADPDRWYVDTGYQGFRTYYDATGGFFPATGVAVETDGTSLHLDRDHFWFEVGLTPPDKLHFKLRYDLNLREGSKDSTEWADLTLPVYSTRNLVPTQLNINEHTQTVTAGVSQATDVQQWSVNVEGQHTGQDDAHLADRQPTTTANRDLTTTNPTGTDLFASTGRYERDFGDRLTFTAGAMASSVDTWLNDASRIYGAGYYAIYSAASPNRQSRDEGFLDLTGGGELKDYVGNLTLDYRPAKGWRMNAAVRFEDQQTSNLSDWTDTTVAATGGAPTLTDESGLSNEHWLYTDEQYELIYTGRPNWTASLRGDWQQGSGNLAQDSIDLDTASSTAFNNTDYDRNTEKYSANAEWYARPGLTFAAQAYYQLIADKADPVIDSTPDDYPIFLTSESFATDDVNLRMTWRPAALLSLITRYDYQRSGIRDSAEGLAGTNDTGTYTSNTISETVTANPRPRLYVVASANAAYDELALPNTDSTVIKNGNSNFIDGSLGAGYALDKLSDLYLDYSMYTTFNFIDDSATTLPFGADEHQDTASVAWVRHQTAHLIYTVKFTYAIYRDGSVGGLDDYTADVLYAEVQYKF